MIFVSLLFLLVFYVFVGLILNRYYKRTNHYKAQHSHIIPLLDLKSDERFDIVNVGSSQPMFAFDYSVTNKLKGSNWAEYPQYFEFDLALLQQYAKHIKRGATVIIPVCVMEFFLGGGMVKSAVSRYYPVVYRKHLPCCEIKKYLAVRYPILRHPLLTKYLIHDNGWKWNGYEVEKKPCKNTEDYLKDAQGFRDRWNAGFKTEIPSLELSDEQKRNIEKNISIISSIVSLCNKKGWKPIICLLPATSYMTSLFTEEFIEKRVVENVRKAAFNVPFLNYWGDERYMDEKWYMNSFFMNDSGRKMMTTVILHDIKHLSKND